MLASSVVVLVIDRLGAGWLGPYGNSWLDTPNFNRLAAQSLLCETVLAASPDLQSTYPAYWTGHHSLAPPATESSSLPALAAAAGASSLLITDDPLIANHPLAASFADCHLLETQTVSACADHVEQTNLFHLFDIATVELRRCNEPTLLWIHAAGMSAPWDAPQGMRNHFADEDDPAPPSFVDPPGRLLPESFDPDELLGFVHAYAGQVALTDLCLGMLLAALDEHPRSADTLLAVTSPRGYPLGEHLRIGPCDNALYGELLHVPLFLRYPRGENALFRTRQILQPHQLYSAIANNGSIDAETGPAVALASATGQRAIRTPAWFLRESRHENQPRYELFAKPDDRWEANEVSSRCADVVELLAAYHDQIEEAASTNRLTDLPPLAETLVGVWR